MEINFSKTHKKNNKNLILNKIQIIHNKIFKFIILIKNNNNFKRNIRHINSSNNLFFHYNNNRI